MPGPDLQALSERQDVDPELIPKILPAEARASFGMLTPELTSLFQRAASIASVREVIPGTSMALIEVVSATESQVAYVKISASDGEKWLQTVSTGPVRVTRAGSALVPAKKLYDALKMAPHQATRVTISDNTAHVLSGRTLWEIGVPFGDRLSVTPQDDEVESFPLRAGALRAALRAVSPAVGTSIARKGYMQAHFDEGRLVGFSGPRMHQVVVGGLDPTMRGDIPSTALPQIISLLGEVDDDDEIEIGSNASRILFRIGAHTLIAFRLNIPFPNDDVRRLLTAVRMDATNALAVNAPELQAVIKRVRISSDPEYSTIRLSVGRDPDSAGWRLTVSARDRNGNAAQESISCAWSGEKGVDLRLNHIHLTDLLGAASDDDPIVIFQARNGSKTDLPSTYVEHGSFLGVLAQSRTA